MRILAQAVRLYSILLVVGLLWIYSQRRFSWNLFILVSEERFASVILGTLGTATFLVLLSLFVSRNFSWAKHLESEFSKVLVPLQLWEILAIALLSGLVEEVFFRGAVQPALGLIPASLLFGLAHFIPRNNFWPWSIYAAFGGFLLGCLFELTRSLLPVIAAHSITNFTLILIINLRHSDQRA